jgi:hypothetical protein
MMMPLVTVSNQGIPPHYPLLPENAEPEARQAVADGVARVSDNAEAPPTASHSLSILRIPSKESILLGLATRYLGSSLLSSSRLWGM